VPTAGRPVQPAAAQEMQRFGQTVAATVERMSNFVQRQQESEAKRLGAEMAADQGAAATLEQLKSRGGPKTLVEQSAFTAAQTLLVDQIETEAKVNIQQILQDAENAQTPFSEVNARLRAMTDIMPATIANLDKGTQQILHTRIAGSAAQAAIKYSGFWNRKLTQDKRGEIIRGLDVRSKEIRTISGGDGPDPMGFAEVMLQDAVRYMRRSGAYTEAEIASWEIREREGYVTDGTISAFERIPTLAGKEKFIEDMEKNPIKALGVQGSRTLRRQFETTVNAMKTELRRRLSEAKTAATALSTQVSNDVDFNVLDVVKAGGMVNPASLESLRQKAMQVAPHDKGRALRKVSEAILVVESTRLHRDKTPAALDQVITEYRTTGIPGAGEKGIDTGAEALIVSTLEGLRDNAERELKKDPLSYAAEVNPQTVRLNPISLMQNPATPGTKEALTAQGAERLQTVQAARAKYQMPDMSPLTRHELGAWKETWQTANETGRLAMLMNLQTAFGSKESAKVYRELGSDKQTSVIAHAGGLVSIGRPEAAREIIKGMAVLESGAKPIGGTGLASSEVFWRYVGSAYERQSQATGSLLQAAQAIYAYSAQGEDAFNEDKFQRALHIAAGGDPMNPQVGGIQTIRDQQVQLPPGVSSEEVDVALNNVTTEMLEQMTGLKVDPGMAENIRDTDRGYYLALAGNDPGSSSMKYYIAVTDPDSGRQIIKGGLNGVRFKIDLMQLISLTKGQSRARPGAGAAGTDLGPAA